MDKQTIEAYNQSAAQIADLHNSLVPTDLYKIITPFFIANGTTADIGCGTGRDSHWLMKQGYHVTGYDASAQMLAHAKQKFQQIPFIQDNLPALSAIKNGHFANVLCSAVLMHLDPEQIKHAVSSLLRIMTDGGVIVLSFRGTDQPDQRENGKLYTQLDEKSLISIFLTAGANLQFCDQHIERSRRIIWSYLVFKKSHCGRLKP